MPTTTGSVTFTPPSQNSSDEHLVKVAGHWVRQSLIRVDLEKAARFLKSDIQPQHIVYLGLLPVDGRTLVYNPATDIYLPD